MSLDHPKSDYSCSEADLDLDRFMDGEEFSADSPLFIHCQTCMQCKIRVRSAQKLHRAIRSLPEPRVPQGFADRMLFAVLADRAVTAHRPPRRSWIQPLFLTAASLILLIGLAIWTMVPDRSTIVSVEASRFSPEPRVAETARLKDRLGEAGASLLARTQRATSQSIPNIPLGNVFAAAPSRQPVNSYSALEEFGSGATNTVQPIASSAKRAINLFRKELIPGAN